MSHQKRYASPNINCTCVPKFQRSLSTGVPIQMTMMMAAAAIPPKAACNGLPDSLPYEIPILPTRMYMTTNTIAKRTPCSTGEENCREISPMMTAFWRTENRSAAAGSASASVHMRFAPERITSSAAMITNAPSTIQSAGSCVKKLMTVSKTPSIGKLYRMEPKTVRRGCLQSLFAQLVYKVFRLCGKFLRELDIHLDEEVAA